MTQEQQEYAINNRLSDIEAAVKELNIALDSQRNMMQAHVETTANRIKQVESRINDLDAATGAIIVESKT